MVASFFCYRALGSDLLPEMDEGGFILDYLMPAGSSLADTNAVLLGVEKILADTPEVESTSRRTGLQLGLAAVTEANHGDFSVKLKRPPARKRGIDEIISEVREKVKKKYPQLDVEFIQVLQDMIGDLTNSPEPMEIKLFSQDPDLLKEWAPKVGDKVKKIKGVVDVKDGIENTISGSAIVMNVDPVVAARAGFTPQEIELDASAILQGEPATTPVVVNDRAYTIRVRFPENTRGNLDEIRNTVITSSSTGKTATLGSLATFKDEAGQTEIIRENLQRRRRSDRAVRRHEPRHRHGGRAAGGSRDESAAFDSRGIRRTIRGAAEIVSGSAGGAGAGGRAGVHGAAVRVPHVRRAHGDSGVGAALDLGRVSGAAGHRNHVQHLLVHGTDHGDRHRGQERHSAAGRRSEVPRAREVRRARP